MPNLQHDEDFNTRDAEMQTAMMLTENEWQDLSYICSCFLRSVTMTPTQRQATLCQRIIVAVEP